jgi:tetratricopeptide (TPR) repeat protein
MDEALALAQRLETSSAMQMYGVQQFALRRMRGGFEEMVPLSAAMVEQYPLIPAWRTGLAYALVESGDLDGAREQLAVLAADDFDGLPRDANWHVGAALCAIIADAVGDERAGAVLYDLLEPYSELMVLAGVPADCVGSGHRFAGLAALAAGRLDEAERHLTLAIEVTERLGSRPLTAGTQVELARVLLRQGEPARARALADAAIVICDEIGMDAIRAKAEAILAS